MFVCYFLFSTHITRSWCADVRNIVESGSVSGDDAAVKKSSRHQRRKRWEFNKNHSSWPSVSLKSGFACAMGFAIIFDSVWQALARATRSWRWSRSFTARSCWTRSLACATRSRSTARRWWWTTPRTHSPPCKRSSNSWHCGLYPLAFLIKFCPCAESFAIVTCRVSEWQR